MTVKDLKERGDQLVAYMQSKIKARDWHGVADAAMDLREVEAQLEIMRLANLKEVADC